MLSIQAGLFIFELISSYQDCAAFTVKRSRANASRTYKLQWKRQTEWKLKQAASLTLHRHLLGLRQGHKLLPQSYARAEHPRLHCRYRDSQRLSQLAIRPSFRLLKYERILQRRIQSAKYLTG